MRSYQEMNKLIPSKDTNFGSKKRNNRAAAIEALRETRDNQEFLSESARGTLELKKEITMGNAGHYSKTSRRREMAARLEARKSLTEDVLVYIMSETITNSLVFDKGYLEENGAGINLNIRDFLKESFKQELITEDSFKKCASVSMREMYNLVEDYVGVLLESDGEEKEEVIEEIKADEEIKGDIEKISTIVKNKVTNVIASEKQLAEINKEDDEIAQESGHSYINKRNKDKTLFRGIIESCISIQKTENIDEDGLSHNDLNMDNVMAEAVIHYTILESLSTCKLISVSAKNAQDYARTISYMR